MKVAISSTYDDKYLFFLPIVTYCWNKLGVDVICFMPQGRFFLHGVEAKGMLIADTIRKQNLSCTIAYFEAPEHKEATYAQCSRLYAACLDLPEDEILITSDVDMAVFKIPGVSNAVTGEYDMPYPQIIGADLVPENQFPMCYVSAKSKYWKQIMNVGDKTYQQCLDELLGEIDCDNMRGNYWAKDQEIAHNNFSAVTEYPVIKVNRAKEGTQFATRRYDRDDSFLLDRLSPDTIDYHLPRPGYEENNFNQILTVLNFHYPNEDFTWLREYRDKYLELL